MNKLLMKAIEWLRRRVTAFKSEKLRVKSEKVEDTQGVYADVDENENLQKVKEKPLNPKP